MCDTYTKMMKKVAMHGHTNRTNQRQKHDELINRHNCPCTNGAKVQCILKIINILIFEFACHYLHLKRLQMFSYICEALRSRYQDTKTY